MERWVAAAAGGGLSDVAGAPALLVAAVVGDLEDAPLVEVQPASLALQPLQNEDGGMNLTSLDWFSTGLFIRSTTWVGWTWICDVH